MRCLFMIQAYRDGDDFDRTLAGLIPSKSFWKLITQMKNVIFKDTPLTLTGTCCPKLWQKRQPYCEESSSHYSM